MTGILRFIVFHRCGIFFANLKQDPPPTKDYDSLYCDAFFIVGVWNRTCIISEVLYIYSKKFLKISSVDLLLYIHVVVQ